MIRVEVYEHRDRRTTVETHDGKVVAVHGEVVAGMPDIGGPPPTGDDWQVVERGTIHWLNILLANDLF